MTKTSYILLFLKKKPIQTRGMLLLTKAKRPLKFKMLCGFNEHAVKLRMHKAGGGGWGIKLTGYLDSPHMLSQYLLIYSEAIKATIKEI